MNKRKCGIALSLLAFMLAVVLGMAHTENAEAATLRLNKSRVTLAKGGQARLKVSGAAKKVKWSSSNKKVASVTKKGVVKAKVAGGARITAKVKKKKLSCNVTVESPKMSQTRLTLNVGESAVLVLQNTSGKVSWHTSDKSVAAVTQGGIVWGVGAGECRIYAKVWGKEFLCMVNVINSTLQPDDPTITPTPTPEPTPIPTPSGGFDENDARNSISYTSHWTDRGIVVITKNNYRLAVRLEVECLYYNSGGVLVGTTSDVVMYWNPVERPLCA